METSGLQNKELQINARINADLLHQKRVAGDNKLEYRYRNIWCKARRWGRESVGVEGDGK